METALKRGIFISKQIIDIEGLFNKNNLNLKCFWRKGRNFLFYGEYSESIWNIPGILGEKTIRSN